MRCRLGFLLAGVLAASAPGHAAAQVVTQKGGGGIAGTALGGTVKGTTTSKCLCSRGKAASAREPEARHVARATRLGAPWGRRALERGV
jgi:hypothetical protein